MISTGLPYLDKLTGGFKAGDNVVWQISDGVPVEHFIRSFFNEANEFNENVIYVSFNFSPHTILRRYEYLFKKKNAILIDAFTHGKGNSDPVFLDFYKGGNYDSRQFRCVENPRDIAHFIEMMNDIEKQCREQPFYIFDSLTGMNELWKDEGAVLGFFTFTCPKLYELNTLAYWFFGRDAHTKEFIAGIMQVTQIVFSISASDTGYYDLRINKLEERTSLFGSQPNLFRVINQDICFEEDRSADLFKIGDKVKNLRKESRITQAELASSLQMTPGAVSQIEHGVVSPSLQTLVKLASVFKKPLDYFIGGSATAGVLKGYLVSKNNPRIASPHKSVSIRQLLVAEELSIKSFLVSIDGNMTVEGPLLLHKGKEFMAVIRGSLKIVIDNETNILQENDSLLVTNSFVTVLQNAGDGECVFMYFLF
ncbi:MAG TPA: helix-turn-helix domain-containing protein [Spirochaetota bacterium]|nr:helix-turn-helix domain-containing protein [Spirochaetota bacterium]HPC40501.1 helix-turn-helix domain-containing protein [Spirochaetota bacterium]HPL17435.1 helix-turn-helix domain-containing protein [Spirochaetota bacterium]HQF07991.1 helix-turn-helix domain-containing protein [Spirochaetota bacterium]HQH96551.1 helix-turn-helix domain-containing protein [Spirochaetota bacterium]